MERKGETVTGLCGVCPSGCAVDIHLSGGRIDRLTPAKGHPRGIVCPRGAAAREIVYSPDRLLHPERRVGGRGEGRFERVSWEQAYDMIAENLQNLARRFGPETVCVYTGRGNFEYGLNEQFAPEGTVESSANAVLLPFGSPNTTGVGSLCYVSYGMIAPRACFGDYMCRTHEDIERAELIIVWGANPATDSPPRKLIRIKDAQKRGARVIVIDPRRSETAKATRARWVGLRPGTDGALALGVLHVLIDEGLYDRNFVENWTHGFDELKGYVKGFPPERVARITWTTPATIRRLARAIGRARSCAICMYTGLEYSNCGVQAIRAVLTIQALAGHLDAPGGKLLLGRAAPRLNRLLTPLPVQCRPPVGSDKYPLYHEVRQEAHAAELPRAILRGEPYPVRAMIVAGASLITSWPAPDLWRRALSSLDFLVTIDRFPTADSLYADLRLPATTMFEIESYIQDGDFVQFRRKVIEPLGEARNDYAIFAGLARRLGYGRLWPQDEAAAVEYALRGTGVTPDELRASAGGVRLAGGERRYRKYERGELRADGRPGFETATGKFEVASEWLRGHGYDALPVYVEPQEGPLSTPEVAASYPLVFNSGARTQSDFRSQHHNIPSLAKRQPWPLVHIHGDDARARGIQDGDEVEVVSPRGRVAFRAHVTNDVTRGVVEANMGGGGPLGTPEWQRANVNQLTDFDNRDPISGFPVYKALLCDVRKRASD
ncbi:MAG: molybdopterin-dependent oxidoreductase [Acidobacteriota bacterium]|nr:molybdopterin-dependent oxidoreductase [Acidobacteriota bacterium]